MRKKPGISLIIAVALIAPTTVFALAKWAEKKWSVLPVYSKNKSLRDFHLQNQDGKTVSLKDWKDKVVVVDFFFTHCPVVCPKMTTGLKEVQTAFGDRNNLLLNSFSVDPVRDSVPQLKAFANRFNIQKNWHLLTGPKKEIYELARKSFSVVADEGDGGEQDFIHSEKLVLLDSHQQIRGYYNGTDKRDIQQLINDIKKLSDEK